MPDTPAIVVVRELHQTQIAVTEVSSHSVTGERSPAIPAQNAYVVCVTLCDFPEHEHFEGNTPARAAPLRAGQSVISDLKRSPSLRMTSPIHGIHFHVRQTALEAIARDLGVRRVASLEYAPGEGIDDPVLNGLARLLAPAFQRPAQANRLFVDHVTRAAGVHIAQAYGGMAPPASHGSRGLTAWQESRAKELIAAHLDGNIAVDDVARACGLSPGHFSRCFRQTTGVAPHQWLLIYRVDKAKDLLRDSSLSLSEITGACGFSDQSHFTRVFTRVAGTSPGAWRRAVGPSR